MKQKGPNVAASVQARLLQLSRNSRMSLQDLLERYCTERLLYRLSRSPHHSRFILKGAMLLIVWGEGSSERVTRDADLLGFGDNSPSVAADTFREIGSIAVDDGVQFEVESIEAEPIRADQAYVGVRVTLRARVGNARIPVQADIGFGDAFTLEPEEIEFPTLLDMPKPVLRAYTKETALAEKFEAMVSLGERNTRMKDYFDVWLLSQRFRFPRRAAGPGHFRHVRPAKHRDSGGRSRWAEHRLRNRTRQADTMEGVLEKGRPDRPKPRFCGSGEAGRTISAPGRRGGTGTERLAGSLDQGRAVA